MFTFTPFVYEWGFLFKMNKTEQLYKQFIASPKITTDTRKDVSESIFFAISGDNFDGNVFAARALKKGANLAVIDNEDFYKGGNYFLVDNTLTALQKLAQLHRANHPLSVIAITGSNGKTTTKELISSVLATAKNIVSTQGNLNNHIGVPLTILNINENTEIAVVEMGANHPGEIEMLCNIARPDTGIITNIGKAHLEGFGNFEGVIAAKNELYTYLKNHQGRVVVNADDPLLMDLSQKMNRFTYGTSNADITGEIIKSSTALSVRWKYEREEHECHTDLFGRYNFYNVLAAIAFGIHQEVPTSAINRAIEEYIPQNNRSQRIETTKNRVILDAYNANPVSMWEAVSSFREYAGGKKSWLILGDMFELGKASPEEHLNMIGKIKESGFERVIFVGPEFYRFRDKNKFIFIHSTKAAAQYLRDHPIENADILVKGSRGMQLEKLLTFL